jgi:parallel beta-helix repeat protein
MQAAIDASPPGSIIEVKGGIYRENVNVSKTVVLAGIGWPKVDAMDWGSGFILSSPGIELSGFEVTNTSPSDTWPEENAGIKVMSNGNLIHDNIGRDNWDSILVYRSADNRIINNALYDSEEGIDLLDSVNTTIIGNYMNNSEDGIYVYNSSGNIIKANQVMNSTDDGIICIVGSSNNRIIENVVLNTGWHGIELFLANKSLIKGNVASDSRIFNILLLGSDENIIEDNIVTESQLCGIYLTGSHGNIIKNNSATSNGDSAMTILCSDDNIITENNLSYNGVLGLELASSEGNLIFKNTLIKNGNFSSYDDSTNETRENRWDDNGSSTGNRYGDYDESIEGCKDKNKDGRCDLMFKIPGGSSVDRHPISSPQTEIRL